ncbi:MAG: addiction module protein [Enterobacterales bacterium]|nr:addiction module protein [Enterobacterales bacterium]
MRAEQIKQEACRLNLSEKLILVEDIWDSIALGNSELPLHDWQKKELDERYSEYKNGDLKLHKWDDVHRNLRESQK